MAKNKFIELQKDMDSDPEIQRIIGELSFEDAMTTAYEGVLSAVYILTKAYAVSRMRCRLCVDPTDPRKLCAHCTAAELEIEEAAKRTVLAATIRKHAEARKERTRGHD